MLGFFQSLMSPRTRLTLTRVSAHPVTSTYMYPQKKIKMYAKVVVIYIWNAHKAYLLLSERIFLHTQVLPVCVGSLTGQWWHPWFPSSHFGAWTQFQSFQWIDQTKVEGCHLLLAIYATTSNKLGVNSQYLSGYCSKYRTLYFFTFHVKYATLIRLVLVFNLTVIFWSQAPKCHKQ